METALAGARDGAWRASIEDANASLGTTDTSIPDDLCCGGDSILGALPSNLTDAADTIDAFKDAVDDCRFPDDCLTQLVNAGTAADFIAFLGVLRTFLEELSALALLIQDSHRDKRCLAAAGGLRLVPPSCVCERETDTH